MNFIFIDKIKPVIKDTFNINIKYQINFGKSKYNTNNIHAIWNDTQNGQVVSAGCIYFTTNNLILLNNGE